jgi:large conductance mechanosensitive channel
MEKIKGFVQEFKDFLREYKVVGLAIGIIIGLASTTFVKALIDDIVMPIITPFIPGGTWETAVLNLGPFAIKWGHFLSALLNFLVIALVVFLIAKFIIGEEKVTKK